MKLVRHRLGYYEAQPRPAPEELSAHYRNLYYEKGERDSQYAYRYTAEELEHKAIASAEARRFVGRAKGSLLEIGYGEGFFLDAFQSWGWNVAGIDFTDKGLMQYFPLLRERVAVGDIYEYVDQAAASSARYDLVVCNNVIEHVLDPLALARSIGRLLKPGGVCRVVVPNDGSWLQREVVKRSHALDEFWVHYPEHLNYFTRESLDSLLREAGLDVVEILGDFPIDLFLLNPTTNYLKERALGRNCHFTRVAFENALFKRSLDELLEFRRGCAKAGIGRDLIVYATRGAKP